MESKETGKNRGKTMRMVAMLAIMTGLTTGVILGAKELYDSLFARYEKKALSQIYGEFDFSRVMHKLERKTLTFPTDKAILQGYYFPVKSPKGLVVVSHGMHAGADDYLPFIMYFVENGYAVFSYDCKGTYASEGDSTVGMCTPLVDLDHALRYIQRDRKLSKLPLFLFGHSWGGYAATAVLSLHREVRGCAAIAPFNDGYTLIREKGEQYAGSLVKEGFPNTFLNIYQKLLFGKYTEHSGVKGINSTSIPVFIAHGNRDSVISFGGQSIISHMSELRQENVTYYVGTGCQSGHNTILHSPQAVAYQEQVKADLAQLKKQKDGNLSEAELEAFCSQVDHALYSQVNEELMHQIVVMFNKARK